MDTGGSFRFLAVTAALLMWVGAVATAGETTGADEGQTPPVEAASPAAPDDGAPDEGGVAPTEDGDGSSRD